MTEKEKRQLKLAYIKLGAIFVFFVAVMISLLSTVFVELSNQIKEKIVLENHEIQETPVKMFGNSEEDYWFSSRPDDPGDSVTITWYNPVVSQCDSDPLVTADMSRIDLDALGKREIRWIAVSRDLLGDYSMGDTIYLESPNPKINGEWVIHDVMNRRFTKRIDLLVDINDDWYDLRSPKMGTIKKV